MITVAIFSLFLSLQVQAQEAYNIQSEIEQQIKTLEKAWNQKDAALFSSVFSTDHSFIVWNGYYNLHQSPAENARSHEGLFKGPHAKSQIQVKLIDSRMIAEDVCLAHMTSSSSQEGKDQKLVFSLLFQQEKGEWKIAALHMTAIGVLGATVDK